MFKYHINMNMDIFKHVLIYGLVIHNKSTWQFVGRQRFGVKQAGKVYKLFLIPEFSYNQEDIVPDLKSYLEYTINSKKFNTLIKQNIIVFDSNYQLWIGNVNYKREITKYKSSYWNNKKPILVNDAQQKARKSKTSKSNSYRTRIRNKQAVFDKANEIFGGLEGAIPIPPRLKAHKSRKPRYKREYFNGDDESANQKMYRKRQERL